MRAFLALLSFLATPVIADDLSLTGTYSGFVVCDRTEDGRPGTFELKLDLRVLQDGERLHITTWSEKDVAAGTRQPSRYRGRAAIADGRVSGYAMTCAPDFDYHETVRILPAMADGDRFSFAAETIFITRSLPGREGRLITESCRWAMMRKSADTPRMTVCPP